MAGDTKHQQELASIDEKRSDGRINVGLKYRLVRNWDYFRYNY